MLPSSYRMRRSADFDLAVRRGVRVSRPRLVLHLVVSEHAVADPVRGSAAPSRVGFVVSRGVGSAVVRNRVKRRLRALMSARVGDLPDGGLLVVRGNPAAAGAGFEDLARELDSALERSLSRVGVKRGACITDTGDLTSGRPGGGDRDERAVSGENSGE